LNKLIKYVIFGVLLLALSYFFVTCYYTLNGGTPWGKHSYKLEVDKYLSNKYPYLTNQIDSVYYSFKNSHYTAYVITEPNKIRFSVTEHENGLWDNYPHAIWIEEATHNCTDILQYSNTKAECEVILNGSGGINDVHNSIPNYAEVQEKLYSSLQVFVEFNRNFTESDYNEVLELKKSLEKARISKQISFTYNDVAFFDVSIEIDTIKELRKGKSYLEQQ
jgi:hypothetical protein